MQWFKSMMALAFIPLNKLQAAYYYLVENKPPNDVLIDRFITYFFDEWMRDEQFIWNHAETIGPRTNNFVEGFHSKLNKLLGAAKPRLISVIEILRNNECDVAIQLERVICSDFVVYRAPKLQHRDNQIEKIIRQVNSSNSFDELVQAIRDLSRYVGDYKN